MFGSIVNTLQITIALSHCLIEKDLPRNRLNSGIKLRTGTDIRNSRSFTASTKRPDFNGAHQWKKWLSFEVGTEVRGNWRSYEGAVVTTRRVLEGSPGCTPEFRCSGRYRWIFFG